MDTASSHLSRDVAALIFFGLMVGMLGLILVEASVPDTARDAGSRFGASVGLALGVVGYAAMLTGLVRWALRTRRIRAALRA